MKKICFMAQFSPPVNGLTKAVETIYNSRIKEEFLLDKINLTNNKRIVSNLIKLIFNDSDIFYFTIAQSRFGNLRDIFLMLIVLLKKKKIIIHLHGGYYRKLYENHMGILQKKLNNYVLRRVSAAIVLGKSLRNIFQGLVEENKIIIIENCVDENYLISESRFIDKITRHNKDIDILYLSNFIESKGYKKVLELCSFFKNNEKVKFHFAGSFYKEEDKKYFLQYLVDNQLKNVKYYGIVEGKIKLNLLMLADIFILPTFYPSEGQPISIIEAMGNGCYIISTNHAGIPDLVSSKKNGELFNRNNIDSMARHIDGLINNPTFIRKIALNNRRKVLENYSESKYVSNIIKVMKEVS